MDNIDKLEATIDHAVSARLSLERGEAGILLLEEGGLIAAAVAAEAQIALVHATLALVEETRTAALVSYLSTLPEHERHEGAAVLATVRQRLGL